MIGEKGAQERPFFFWRNVHNIKLNGFSKMSFFRRDAVRFFLLAGAVVLIWLGAWAWIDSNIYTLAPWVESSEQARGTFGDKFGAVNSLFSGLAFAGIIFTVLLQRRELALQREEIARNRDQLVEQNKTLSRQRFENTFFKLLELQVEINSKLDMLGASGLKAHGAFYLALIQADREFQIYRSLSKLSREQIREIKDTGSVPEGRYPELLPEDASTLEDAIERIPRAFDSYLDDDMAMHHAKLKAAYEKVAAAQLANFAHYFRSFYHALQFIDANSDLEAEEKKKYAKILRSQLSDTELIALFYNAAIAYDVPGRRMELGYPKLGALLVKYGILQNINEAVIIHRTHLELFRRNYEGSVPNV